MVIMIKARILGLSESFEVGGLINIGQEYMQVADLICHYIS